MYSVEFAQTAASDLARLDKPIAQRVLNKVRWLAENFEVLTPQPLTGDWAEIYKFRVGDYRVLYKFDETKRSITIYFVRHRREVYKSR